MAEVTKVTATHATATAATPPKATQRDLAGDLGELDTLCKENGLPGLAGALAQLIGERYGIRR